jgi:malate dehydrogenase (oxaloacetate-decarboxylating)(NADP+)
LAGILASLKARGFKQDDISKEKIICVGAGSAGVGVCEGIIDCMVAQGKVTREEAYSRIYMLDQHGLLGNPDSHTDFGTRQMQLDERQKCYVKRHLPDQLGLEALIKEVKPTVILGLTGIPGVFTEGAVREMAKHHAKPVIFPLSNPDTHAECTAEQAFQWTDGRAIFASGSPFKDVLLPNGKLGRTNQCNNSYSFPVSFFSEKKKKKKKSLFFYQLISPILGPGFGYHHLKSNKGNKYHVFRNRPYHCRHGHTRTAKRRHLISCRESA